MNHFLAAALTIGMMGTPAAANPAPTSGDAQNLQPAEQTVEAVEYDADRLGVVETQLNQGLPGTSGSQIQQAPDEVTLPDGEEIELPENLIFIESSDGYGYGVGVEIK